MNYYKANNVSAITVEHPIRLPNHPWRGSKIYTSFNDNDHESLARCSECRLKFPIETLVSMHPGTLLCRLCLKGGV